MSYPLNYPTPQYANIQTFYAPSVLTTRGAIQTWVKPQGASFVWFTLIGGGGGGGTQDGAQNGGGGGSAAVTNCLMPAFLIPDSLQIFVGRGGLADTNGTATIIRYTSKASYDLISANPGQGGVAGGVGVGGTASTSNYFSAAGFFQSVAGQQGALSASISNSVTTFLGGGTTQGFNVLGNYGYTAPGGSAAGFFQMQPIIVGLGSSKDTVGTGRVNGNGIGCGGGGSNVSGSNTAGTNGGNGLVVIISW
jgi:hypothetical protein